jgi:hypothetical protein
LGDIPVYLWPARGELNIVVQGQAVAPDLATELPSSTANGGCVELNDAAEGMQSMEFKA